MKITEDTIRAFALGKGDRTAAFALSRLSQGKPITPAERDSVGAIRLEFEEMLRKTELD